MKKVRIWVPVFGVFFLLALMLFAQEKEEKKPKYVGAEKCKMCHKKHYKAWKKTPHAEAFQLLVDSAAVADTACLGCHTTGYGKPGGFVDTTTTIKLTNVGCECCHGPGSEYGKTNIMKDTTKAIEMGLVIKPTEKECNICHTKKRSPKFDFCEYKKKGIHEIPEEEEGEEK